MLLALAACPGERVPVTKLTPPTPHGTSLVVVIVVDQLPQWAFIEKRQHLTRGFARLLREGDWKIGEHPSAATLTAPGHALIGTGQPPAKTGILANEWFDRASAKMVGSIEDPAGGVSAARLRVPGLGSAVQPGGKAIAVSLKERAALLTLGSAGTPIWYDKNAVAFTSSKPLAWLAAHTRARPITLGYVWTPADPARLAELSKTTDDQPGEIGEKGFDATFPHAVAETKVPADAIFATPLGNDLVFDVAEAAIAGEQLGADAIPDVLVLSLSAHDYIGHGWGHESWEAWDATLRLDERLHAFLAALDHRVGTGRWALVLTSDHGASPLPERIGGGRITHDSIVDATNRAAIAELGAGTWIGSSKFPYVWLSDAARAQPARERNIALKKIMFALRSYPGIDTVGKTADFAGNCEMRTGDAAAICWMIDPERAGEIFYLPKPGWIFQWADEPQATAHGSLHDYDRHVPVIIVEPGAPAHGPQTDARGTIPMQDVHAIVSRWLTGRTYSPR